VSGSETGFIYVSMGSSVLTAKMPEVLRLIFIRAFAQLPYRVLWKWEADENSIADLPGNVRLARWLPQQDILGQSPFVIANDSHETGKVQFTLPSVKLQSHLADDDRKITHHHFFLPVIVYKGMGSSE